MKKQLPRLKAQFTSNGVYKLVALLVASIVWVSTLWGQKDIVWIRDMDVEVLLNPGFTLKGKPQKTVKVKLAGPKTALRKLRNSTKVITLNLNKLEEGRHVVEISDTWMDLPIGVKFLSAEPNKVKINVKKSEIQDGKK